MGEPHFLFSLVDQYCGKTHYEQPSQLPNVWSSLANCQTDAANEGWTLGNCRRIEWDYDPAKPGLECQKDFWRYDPDTPNPDYMNDHVNNPRFHEADARRMVYVLNQYSLSTSLADTVAAGTEKGLLVRLNINQGKITELYTKAVKGFPKLGLQDGPFRVEVYSKSGAQLYSFNIWDPRLRVGAPGKETGELFTDNVNFSIIFPYPEDVQTLEVKDRATNDKLIAINIPDSLKVMKEILFLPLILR